jgi:hypothetical protein
MTPIKSILVKEAVNKKGWKYLEPNMFCVAVMLER